MICNFKVLVDLDQIYLTSFKKQAKTNEILSLLILKKIIRIIKSNNITKSASLYKLVVAAQIRKCVIVS